MTVTASDIKRLRSMINEPTATTWTDYDLTTMIEASACIDTLGNIPTDANWTATSTFIPLQANFGWKKLRNTLMNLISRLMVVASNALKSR